MANRHILRGDGGVRTMCSANRHHLCGWAPGYPAPIRVLFWRLPDDDELRVARPVAVVLLATVPRCDSRTGY